MLSLRLIRRFSVVPHCISTSPSAFSADKTSSVRSCGRKPVEVDEPALVRLKKERDPEKLFNLFKANSCNRVVVENRFAFEDTVSRLAGAGRFDYIENLLEHQKTLPQGRREGFILRIIMLYGRAGMTKHAVNTFYDMHLYGCKRTVKSFNATLKVLTQSRDLVAIESFLTDVPFRFGIKLDVFSVNIVVKAFCEMGILEKAYLVLVEMGNMGITADVITYTTLIAASYEDNRPEIANGLWNLMLRKGCFPNVATFNVRVQWGKNCIPNIVFYNTLIHGYCKRGDVKRAYGLLEDLKRKGFLPTEETYGAIIYGFCKQGNFEKVNRILKQMESRGMGVNVQVYNNILDAKYKCGFIREALELARKMIELGCNLDIVTYNSLISNACRDGKIQDAEMLLAETLERGLVPNKLSFTPLIHAYCQKGDFDQASSLVIKMTECGHKPDLITYGGLVHGLVVAGEMDAALTIRNKMIEKEVPPDACIYNVLINGLCREGRFADAKQLSVEMLSHNISPDVYVYATLLDGCIRGCNLDDAKKLFEGIINKGMDPGLVGYNAMLKGYCKFGMMNDAVLCMSRMTNRNIKPDEFTYSTIIDGYIKQNNFCSAVSMFSQMLKRNIAPNVVTYTSLLSGFCQNGDFKGAEKIFKTMETNAITPNVVTYTILIGSLCKKGDLVKAALIFERMLGSKCSPNDVTFHYLINGLSNNSASVISRTDRESDHQMPMLLNIFGAMISDGSHPISGAYISIISCLCLHRMLGIALQLTDKMLHKGFVPDQVTFVALLYGFCSEGKSKDWRSIIPPKLIGTEHDVALTYWSIFSHYTSHEVTSEVSLILHHLARRKENVVNETW
ncbi:pentatricopeptide repeat-containing protein [Dorcoceras hygrometricum]|uniref:Pentatricopeptide repeat-containing protein n=1 Tax=Dorcoceras hygrometricum TaxID=472368 RepID=A0A2Z7AW43_9LAMI|nr:pentatricopeptide repeat-containing protein [Dorcoceras hygrometricum]